MQAFLWWIIVTAKNHTESCELCKKQFFNKFLFEPRSILWSHWLLLFWTSCVLPHGFQIQSGYLACILSCLCAVILKVTTGVTPAFSTNRGVHCISVYTVWLARLLSHALEFEPPTQWWAAQRCMTKENYVRLCKIQESPPAWMQEAYCPQEGTRCWPPSWTDPPPRRQLDLTPPTGWTWPPPQAGWTWPPHGWIDLWPDPPGQLDLTPPLAGPPPQLDWPLTWPPHPGWIDLWPDTPPAGWTWPPPVDRQMDGQTRVKTLPSHRTTYAGGNYSPAITAWALHHRSVEWAVGYTLMTTPTSAPCQESPVTLWYVTCKYTFVLINILS